MARYIDEDKVREALLFKTHFHFSERLEIINMLKEVPTADVVERKRGKWHNVFIDGLGFNGFEFECSECGKRSAGRTNYCAYCGADMRRETDDAIF